MEQSVVRLSTWNEARDALRHRDLRQGLYDEGNALMEGVIVNLHGSDHLARRRLENRLFRRDTFLQWERNLIPQLIGDVLGQLADSTEADMVQIARRTMMRLSSLVAGIDLGADLASFDKMSHLMAKLAAASTVVHATGDKQDIINEGNLAFNTFLAEYFSASRQRREHLVEQATQGSIEWSDLPADVLTVLLTNQDNLDLPDNIIAREIAYLPWVGSHSTSGALVHALHHCFTWESEHGATLAELTTNSALLQRFVHESLRLHPASPEATRIATADVQLPCGVHIPAGATVVINMVSANRDVEIFGSSADAFDPYRTTPLQAPRWGLTFGTGFHACLGQELAGGLGEDQQQETPLYGAIVAMLQSVFQRGAIPHRTHCPELDIATRRPVWKSYPVSFIS